MDTRDTPEQAELRRTARQLARELGPRTVADLDDEKRGPVGPDLVVDSREQPGHRAEPLQSLSGAGMTVPQRLQVRKSSDL